LAELPNPWSLIMSDATPRFGLPFILPGQAQKEFFHNEALTVADALLHPAVEAAVATPPAQPQPGQSWLAAPSAAGAWSGQDGRLATWSIGGWRFSAPVEGMQIWDRSAQLHRTWSGSTWSDGALRGSRVVVGGLQIVGARQPAVPSPSGGTIIDAEARSAIAGLIVTLKSHGLID
jgi:hypothetical protein